MSFLDLGPSPWISGWICSYDSVSESEFPFVLLWLSLLTLSPSGFLPF